MSTSPAQPSPAQPSPAQPGQPSSTRHQREIGVGSFLTAETHYFRLRSHGSLGDDGRRGWGWCLLVLSGVCFFWTVFVIGFAQYEVTRNHSYTPCSLPIHFHNSLQESSKWRLSLFQIFSIIPLEIFLIEKVFQHLRGLSKLFKFFKH